MKNSDAVDVLLDKDKAKVMYFALSAGLRIGESLQAISEGIGIPVQELKALSDAPAQFGVPAKAKNLEGYLAPGEYRFPLGTSAKDILQKLVDTTQDELKAQGVTDPAKQYDVVTVASIVQAEGGQAEYGDVAGAIYNRLKPNNTETNGLIQSDATVTYGLGIRSFHIDEAQKADKSNPYNTYANQGLPAGPIGSPGKTAIDAAAKPKSNELPVLGHHQPGHQGDEVLQDAGGTQRLRGAVQRLVRGQPGTLRMRLRAAVLGHPISHSKSPALHRAAYAQLGVDIAYSAIDVTEAAAARFHAAGRGRCSATAWRGLSVTMPLKIGHGRGSGRGPRRGARTRASSTRWLSKSDGGSPAATGRLQHRRRGDRQRPSPRRGARAPVRRDPGRRRNRGSGRRGAKELGAVPADVFVRDRRRAAEARAAAAAVGRRHPGASPRRGGRRRRRGRRRHLHPAAPRGRRDSPRNWPKRWRRTARTPRHRASCWTSPTIPGPAGSPRPGRQAGGTVVPGLEMLIYQAVEQVRHFTGLGDAVTADVIDVMCDAVGAAPTGVRNRPTWQDGIYVALVDCRRIPWPGTGRNN